MYVRFILLKDRKEELLTTMYDEPKFLPEKGDEVILTDKNENYKELSFKVVKRSFDFVYDNKEASPEPYEVKIFLKYKQNEKSKKNG